MPRVPQQARSRKTLERIVNAGLAVVAEHGAEEATIQEIVRRARSSVGSFYSRFAGKEELIAYLQEQVWDDALERWTDALGAAGVSEAPAPAMSEEATSPGEPEGSGLRGAVDSVVHALLADRAGHSLRVRAFAPAQSWTEPEPMSRFREGVLNLVRQTIAPHEVQIGHPEPPLAILLGFYAASGALGQLERDASITLDDEALGTELARIYMGYLSGEAGYASDSAQVADPFDVWT